jgi:23S rRNA (cytidine1920-2'-O)/16S rRNA (cytidine1409-2'-O)-methyltransferase
VKRRARVDAELVRRGLARSRQQAAELIGAGRVSVDGMPAAKPATAIALSAHIAVDHADEPNWVSRGAHKLVGALDAFALSVDDRRCLDAGASTGGLTQVLLDRGAREVVALDVGYGQLAWSLPADGVGGQLPHVGALHDGNPRVRPRLDQAVCRAVAEGPQ